MIELRKRYTEMCTFPLEDAGENVIISRNSKGQTKGVDCPESGLCFFQIYCARIFAEEEGVT